MNENRKGSMRSTNSIDDPNIVRSPLAEEYANLAIPDVPFTDILFRAIDANYEAFKDRVWVGDVLTGVSYKYRDIKPMARKIASMLTRMGFKKGDVMFYCTYECALIYLLSIGVWLCGGAIRSCFHKDERELYLRRMRESLARFAICDSETADSVKWAASQLDWSVTILSIGGEVEGALSIQDLIKNEDCSAYPENVKINTKQDISLITNTSGSTGVPKGVICTYHSFTEYLLSAVMGRSIVGDKGSSILTTLRNTYSSIFFTACTYLLRGASVLTVSKFEANAFTESILKYKPAALLVYPHELHAFLQPDKIKDNDFSFIRAVGSLGSVLHYSTAKKLEALLPQVKLMSTYGTSEALVVASSRYGGNPEIKNPEYEGIVAGVKYITFEGDPHLSCGPLFPGAMAKIVDPTSGISLGRNTKGTLLIKSTILMKGYLHGTIKELTTGLNDDGWYDTGDEGFFDEDGCLYIMGRNKFTFKHCAHWVSPTNVETVIMSHPAVESAVVVGVPNPETTADAKAYVILKPGCTATAEEIEAYVAGKAEEHKHLHGGVAFVDKFPFSSGGKIDRPALLKRAIEESTHAA
ncbi:4-coumarate--CoA ligase-like 1 [Ischnura elegans]|uniref:4-coumarate--CoA ligase-like 1 n=1 Tax=Ischnura elegans TaxID=197161 RepID=UPI001ED8A9C6|nr:4-coumarate--CoA ligase-like 1 [Ischnura elegans]